MVAARPLPFHSAEEAPVPKQLLLLVEGLLALVVLLEPGELQHLEKRL
jgi:hypothetical protein